MTHMSMYETCINSNKKNIQRLIKRILEKFMVQKIRVECIIFGQKKMNLNFYKFEEKANQILTTYFLNERKIRKRKLYFSHRPEKII